MQRCSEKAFAMCPDRMYCGSIEDATFEENSECAEFNRAVENKPMTNADCIRAMSDEELAIFLSEWAQKPWAWEGDSGVVEHWLRQPAEEDDRC